MLNEQFVIGRVPKTSKKPTYLDGVRADPQASGAKISPRSRKKARDD